MVEQNASPDTRTGRQTALLIAMIIGAIALSGAVHLWRSRTPVDVPSILANGAPLASYPWSKSSYPVATHMTGLVVFDGPGGALVFCARLANGHVAVVASSLTRRYLLRVTNPEAIMACAKKFPLQRRKK